MPLALAWQATADALLPPHMQRNFVNQFSSGAARTHDAYIVGRNAYVIIPPDLKIALDVVRAKRRSVVEERRAFVRNPRVAIAEALELSGPEVAPLFIETASYSERVEGLGIWEKIALPPISRTGGWMPENWPLTAPVASRVTRENIDEIRRAVEAAEAAGRTEVMIDGEVVPIAPIRARARAVPGGA